LIRNYSGNSLNRRFVIPAMKHDDIKKINWFASLSQINSKLNSKNKKLHFLKPLEKQSKLNIILLDTSASTLGKNSLSDAKGAIKQLVETAYLKRESLCLLTFGNERIEVTLHPQRAPKNIGSVLANIKAGGGTPLRKALLQVSEFINKKSNQYQKCILYVFTDGRSRESVEHVNIACDVMLVDTENSAVKLGLGKNIASSLNAQYVHL